LSKAYLREPVVTRIGTRRFINVPLLVILTSLVFSASLCVFKPSILAQSKNLQESGPNPAGDKRSADQLGRAIKLNQQALELNFQGKFDEALPLAEEAVKLREDALGPTHLDVAASLNTLGLILHQQVKLVAARNRLERALEIRKRALDAVHPDVAESLTNLARVLYADGDFAEARKLLADALAIYERTSGRASPETAVTLTHFGIVQSQLGNLADAETQLETAVVILQKARNSQPADLAMALNFLGNVRGRLGDFAGARTPLERSLQIREQVFGPNHPHVARTLARLAGLLEKLGDTKQALRLAQRALEINEQALGETHAEVAGSLNEVARLRQQTGDLAEAQRLFERALKIQEDTVGAKHPFVAVTLNSLAQLRRQTGDLEGARALLQRALKVQEESIGRDHPFLADTLTNLAYLEGANGNLSVAESLLTRALEVRERALGPNHPDVAQGLNDRARAFHAQGNLAAARPLYERARQIYLSMGRVNENLDDDALNQVWKLGLRGLQDYGRLLAGMAQQPGVDRGGSAMLEGFFVAEQARIGAAQVALARAAARVASASSVAADLARQVQDLRSRRQLVNSQLTAEYGKLATERNNNLVERLRAESQKLEQDLTRAVSRLTSAFPKYGEITSPEPIEVPAVRRLLSADEALVSFWVLDDRLLIWLIRPNRDATYRDLQINRANLMKVLRRVRVSQDQSENRAIASLQLAAFDVGGANQLYRALFSQIEEQLGDVRHLIIVPDEMLLPLPFGTLITDTKGEAYKKAAEQFRKAAPLSAVDLANYRDLSWLVKRFAITVLPSATSLRALRQVGQAVRGQTEPFIGFGDPVLDGDGGKRGGAMLATRGAAFSLRDIRRLSRLPGTRMELTTIAGTLGADPRKALYLSERATEPAIKRLNESGELAKTRVIAFATHGLLAGQISGLKQPALVLTPPENASEQDNGLLELEEILSLNLVSADWAVLSACNTGVADGSGEGLSGLVRAFFFAGAKSLLVSHWSVDDSATQSLMAEVFRHYAKEKNLSRAEALREGMLAVMADKRPEKSYYAHPFAWGPFFLVGEGERRHD
jgi:CHAT domain-containing protein/Tfp pilus assembly protein PilF